MSLQETRDHPLRASDSPETERVEAPQKELKKSTVSVFHRRQLGAFSRMPCVALVILIFFCVASGDNGIVQAKLQRWEKVRATLFSQGRSRAASSSTTFSLASTTTDTYETYTEIHLYEHEAKPSVPKSSRQAVTTAVGALIQEFENVIVADNKKTKSFAKEDIHVGHLLSACEQLVKALRKAGISQCADVIEGNMKKIQRVRMELSKQGQQDSMSSILNYEVDPSSAVHTIRGGRLQLRENSAAMGFLWLGRNIQYQYDLFHYMLDHDNAEPYEAAKNAYEKHLKPHLSWGMQKLCQAALTALKSIKKDLVYSRMGGFEYAKFGSREEEAITRDLRRILEIWTPLLSKWKRILSELDIGAI